ncbi:MAG: tRNA (adenosine(37)-N6)-threonylcarbamoyltransferase complex transferase subunit TsaD, partial [Planctomycetales bacterium]|nr:tRNA (adenosine(37)-N6)-threonylcarbamoyltransferase complex transferase subunit TsaD [Planctomycetales bacterium]
PYPGGPAISRVAEHGDPTAYAFPRSFLHEPDKLQFSFSGLKTAVRYQIVGPGKTDFRDVQLSEQQVADLAASFEAAVVDCLTAKARQAICQTGLRRLCVGGGVAANRRFRTSLEAAAEDDGFELHIAPLKLCTDNAVMGAIAIERLRAGLVEPLDLKIQPGLERA